MKNEKLETLADHRKLRIHEPFAEFLKSENSMHSFEISLLDCYRMAGHACYAITGAFLATEAAIQRLYPESTICERGDLKVDFPSCIDEGATGPKSNVISFITGAWASSGFPGLRGNFRRKDLLSYGDQSVPSGAIRFTRLSTGKSLLIQYDPKSVIANSPSEATFPESWRHEICQILANSEQTIQILPEANRKPLPSTTSSQGADGPR